MHLTIYLQRLSNADVKPQAYSFVSKTACIYNIYPNEEILKTALWKYLNAYRTCNASRVALPCIYTDICRALCKTWLCAVCHCRACNDVTRTAILQPYTPNHTFYDKIRERALTVCHRSVLCWHVFSEGPGTPKVLVNCVRLMPAALRCCCWFRCSQWEIRESLSATAEDSI